MWRKKHDSGFFFPSVQVFYLWIGRSCSEMFIRDVLGRANYASIPPDMVSGVLNGSVVTAVIQIPLKSPSGSKPPIGASAPFCSLHCCLTSFLSAEH